MKREENSPEAKDEPCMQRAALVFTTTKILLEIETLHNHYQGQLISHKRNIVIQEK